MRMFLVGMCDVFLLLYLTAVAQVDARRISDINVKDYISLKQEHEAQEGEQRHTLAELQLSKKQAQDTLSRVKELEAALAASKKDKESFAKTNAEAEQRTKEARLKLE